jgi:hypothetical protein
VKSVTVGCHEGVMRCHGLGGELQYEISIVFSVSRFWKYPPENPIRELA